jgi:hypothetical protein
VLFEGAVNFVLLLTLLLGVPFVIFILFIKLGLAVDLRPLAALNIDHQPM